jgi:gliding motility-associated protein GldL
MAHKKESGLEFFYRVIVPKVTSVGAALVVIGALFKIMSWPGAGVMLTVGLSTEAFLFLMGVFQPAPPPEVHFDWTLVYPELAGGAGGKDPKKTDTKGKDLASAVAMDQLLASANLTEDSFKKFGAGIQSLNQTASNIKNITEAVSATNDYSGNLKEASKSISSLNKAYATTIEAMSGMAAASKDAKEYHTQVQAITKNLGALNAVYEMELKDANNHLKAMNKFYGNLTTAMQNMADASKESQLFKEQMSLLTGNLTTLNTIYGNMLTAMRGK